ncbi:hypothetical protein IAD21_00134 [Abditibacteriota bacterium]|nr:hypothetical protein IAD21_00134 [Abditibacteriota bacterium]
MATPLTDQQWQKLPTHPRLFADDARIAVLKTQNDDVSQQLLALLRSEADKELHAAPIVYPNQGFLMGPMREVQGRILTLALMYRLSGEKRYFERARQELLQLTALSEWRPLHFLDVGEGALAAGIGLDWLYDDLTPQEREQIADAIVKNALIPSLDVSVGGASWMNGDFNWNPVCNAGLTVGALAVFEREPKLARQVIERAIQSLPFAAATYAPDGTYPEGPSYWSYGTTFYVIMIEALRSSLGTSLDLTNAPGFLETTDFMAQMQTPSSEEYNFSDYHSGEARSLSEPVMLWFAREKRNRSSAHNELKNLETLFASLQTTGTARHASRHLALEFLWWDPALPPSEVDDTLPLHWTAGGKLPLAVLRTAWNSPRATYVAVKGGTPDGSHAHMDGGSFILEANGVRWALDLGTESYDKMRATNLDLWNYSQESSRWTTFRVGPEGHNILRFDGARQNVSGNAEIRALPDENGVKGNAVVLSSLYKNQVERALRTVRLFPDGSVSFHDEWKTGERGVQVSWQWLTRATITRTLSGVLLKQAGESLELKIESPTPFRITIEDVSRPRNPQDSPNPGLSRVVVHLQTAARSEGKLEIQAIPGR